MKTISAKTRKIMAYLEKNPQAKVKDVAKRFGVHISRIYAVRKRMQADFIRDVIGEVPPMPALPKFDPKHLTDSQKSRAKKMGMTPEQYAEELNKYGSGVVEEDQVPMPTPEQEAAIKAAFILQEAAKTKKQKEERVARYFGNDVNKVLDSRAVDYGKFKDGARLMQGMKRLMADHAQAQGKTFADDQWEALEMIVHKIGRIVNGNSDKVDHWTDIAGYATLVADRLEGRVR